MEAYLIDPKFLVRFWSRVKRTDGCWEWQGSTTKAGYGQIGYGRNLVLYTHRVAYELMHGEIPAGLSVLHRCDNPPCVRVHPDHLYTGTQAQNVRDAAVQGHMRRDVPSERLRRMSELAKQSNPGRKPKLTAEQVAEVHRRREAGETQLAVALAFGVSQATISNAIHGKVKYARKGDK